MAVPCSWMLLAPLHGTYGLLCIATHMHITGTYIGVQIVMSLVTTVHGNACTSTKSASLFLYVHSAGWPVCVQLHSTHRNMQVLGCAYATYALNAESLNAILSWLCKYTPVASSKPFHKYAYASAIIGTTDLPHVIEVEVTSTRQK